MTACPFLFEDDMEFDSDSGGSSSSAPTPRSKRSGSVRGGLKAAGSGLRQMSQDFNDSARSESSVHPVQYRKGGKVKGSRSKSRAVPIIAHENERVIPSNKRKKVERLMKRAGMTMTNRKRRSSRKGR